MPDKTEEHTLFYGKVSKKYIQYLGIANCFQNGYCVNVICIFWEVGYSAQIFSLSNLEHKE